MRRAVMASLTLPLTLALALACLAPAALATPATPQAQLTLTPVKVSQHTWFFQGGAGMADDANKGFMSNAGFVVTADSVLVFDTLGTPALGAAMVRAIRTVTPLPVKRVIISHYHADHFYGAQAFKAEGAEIWAHEKGRDYLASDLAASRLAQRKISLKPWVDDSTQLLGADRWLNFSGGKTIAFTMGGLHFRLIDMGGAHAPDDLLLAVDDDHMLFAGDLFFTGRIPFVGDADSKVWLAALDRMLDLKPLTVVPGHGAVSRAPAADLQLTRSYLLYLRRVMGDAVAEMTSFEEAYRKADWRAYEKYPAFEQANRLNAYGTYILMEQESLKPK